ncbi:hypothetical protein BRC82_06495 [Halobacteriales archaeon QS_1_67_19]|nr:MAG: hypothetical protein BRC82_06495 [Halobacteriales archaeon QS_1_67_19]
MWPGVAALGLFAVLAWVFVGANFGDPAGFPEGASITASIGYAMFNIQAPDAVPSEGFLVTFILIAVVLDAALDGAVMLASREAAGEITTALRSDAVESESSPQDVVADGGERTEGSRSSSDRRSDGGDR